MPPHSLLQTEPCASVTHAELDSQHIKAFLAAFLHQSLIGGSLREDILMHGKDPFEPFQVFITRKN